MGHGLYGRRLCARKFRKWESCCTSFCGPHLTQCSTASFILIHPKRLATIHQLYRQDNGPIAQGKPFCKWSPKNGSRCAIGPLSLLSVCNVGVLWPSGWMDQDSIWYGDRPRLRPHCVRCGPSSPQRGTAPPNFRHMSTVAKRLDGSRCDLVRR